MGFEMELKGAGDEEEVQIFNDLCFLGLCTRNGEKWKLVVSVMGYEILEVGFKGDPEEVFTSTIRDPDFVNSMYDVFLDCMTDVCSIAKAETLIAIEGKYPDISDEDMNGILQQSVSQTIKACSLGHCIKILGDLKRVLEEKDNEKDNETDEVKNESGD